MKKKLIILIFLIVIFSIGIIIFLPKEEMKENNVPKTKTSEYISVMLQNEEGNYEKSNDGFPTEGYRFNKNKSKCVNGSEIAYENNEVIVKTVGTDKCYAYFDNNNFVEDLSGKGNHGTITNVISWNEDGLEVALGYHNRVSLQNNDLGNEVSLIARIKAVNNGNTDLHYRDIFGAGTAANGANQTALLISMQYENNSLNPYFQVGYGSNHTYVMSSKSIEVNSFYTLVGIYDNRQIYFYVNGVLAANKLMSNDRLVDDSSLFFSGGFTFSDILVFDRALSEEEIASDYINIINPTNKDDLLLWYKFDMCN